MIICLCSGEKRKCFGILQVFSAIAFGAAFEGVGVDDVHDCADKKYMDCPTLANLFLTKACQGLVTPRISYFFPSKRAASRSIFRHNAG